jgi:heterodisulfide reductase subunit C
MHILDNIFFAIILAIGVGFFTINIKKLIRNIKLGKKINRTDEPKIRFNNMLRIAFGQSKMVSRPIPAVLHIIVYVGFVIINIEMIEIIIDGLFGTHRVLSFLGPVYDILIASFEILAFLVLIAVILFWIRRNIIKTKRLVHPDLDGYAKKDGNTILYFEVALMFLFLLMNAADYTLQLRQFPHYHEVGSFPISQYILPLLTNFSDAQVFIIERMSWWMHIVGILLFLNYLYYSKHLHILLAFPNTYFSDINALGKFDNLESVTNEVKLMLDPNANPYAATDSNTVPEKFGASDVMDLNQIQLLNAYSCTECGRCTDACPANATGKKLSPRKIMMSTRDRLEEVGKILDTNKGTWIDDGKTLLNSYITPEELWACTTCNACVEECPISISPLSIIMDMRRFLVMEQSAAPQPINAMLTNIENNAAPWQYNQMDRLNWKNEL